MARILHPHRAFELSRRGWRAAPARFDVFALALLAALWAALAAAGWGAWIDPHVDDGRELQLPVEIVSGKVLYRDLAYAYGPAAPYLNAAFVSIAGPRVEAFFGLGLALTLICAALVYAVMRVFTTPALAWVPAAYLLAAGMRPWFSDIVVPYSFAAVYGLAAVLAALWLACSDMKPGEPRSTPWISALACFAMLNKVEFALPALLIAGVHAARFKGRNLAMAAIGPATAVVAYIGLALWLGREFMFQDNFNWTPDSYFFRQYGGALLSAAAWKVAPSSILNGAGWWIVIWIGSALVLGRLPERLAWAGAAAAGIFLWYRAPFRVLRHGVLPEALFWAVVTLGAIALCHALRRRTGDAACVALAAAVGVAVSLRAAGDATPADGLLPYAIPLVMAAAALVQAAGELAARRLGGRFHPAAAATLLASALLCLIANRTSGQEFVWRGGLDPVHGARGSIYIGRGEAKPVQQAIDFLSVATRRGERVWIMPEDMTLAYLSSSGFPYRHYQLLPGYPAPDRWTRRLLDQVRSSPTEWALLCTRRFDEYGVRWFGVDVHRQVLEFLDRRYEPVRDFGDFSLTPGQGQWGARLYRLRRPPSLSQADPGAQAIPANRIE